MGVDLSIDGKKKYPSVHVLVATAFIPNPDNKPEVNHVDGMKFNCHVDNLEWATHEENVQHAFDNGLNKSAQGIDDSQAKIKSERDLIYIRDNPDKLSQYELAQKFGMSQRAINKIQLGKSYSNDGGTIRQAKPKKPRVPDEIRLEVRRLRTLDQKKYSYSVLGEMFKISNVTAWKICREN